MSRLWAVESKLARFGPTTPKRAGRLADASVDPTDARCAEVKRVVCVPAAWLQELGQNAGPLRPCRSTLAAWASLAL
jgi:hypothetical protein